MPNLSSPGDGPQVDAEDAVRHAHLSFRAPSWGDRLMLSWGVLRRLLLRTLRPGRIRTAIAFREGDCHRCGACCQMTVRCPNLKYEDGLSTCAAYGARPGNCRDFPVDRRDLADRDRIAPNLACGYTFRAEVRVEMPVRRRDHNVDGVAVTFQEGRELRTERSG